MAFLDEDIEKYIEQSSSGEPELLHELYRATHLRLVQPRMISGSYQGRLLSLISKLKRPKRILEIGTFTGYSALCMAEGLSENGELITIDKNEELVPLARKFFDKSQYGGMIKMLTGQALDIIPRLGGEFDMVFMDADKKNYLKYFELIADKISSGGILVSDNVLWYGKVVREPNAKDTDTAVISQYNRRLRNDRRFESVMLPVRDGITLSIKR